MKSSYSSLMQSKYFSPAFNSAIFDGPLRIYFAQFHESLALKIYFLIQQRWPTEFAQAKEFSKASHANVLLMIYPTEDSFLSAMGSEAAAEPAWACEAWNQDMVIALRKPIEDHQIDDFLQFCGNVLASWSPRTLELRESAAPA